VVPTRSAEFDEPPYIWGWKTSPAKPSR